MRRMASSGGGELLDRASTFLLLAIVLLVLVVFGSAFRRPYSEGLAMRRKADEAAWRVERLRQQNEALEADLRYAKTDRGMEVEARKQQFVRSWESPLRVVFRGGAVEKTGPDGTAGGSEPASGATP